jgi:hypothetical protein
LFADNEARRIVMVLLVSSGSLWCNTLNFR